MVYVSVFAEEAWCCTNYTPTCARNVLAIADTGAQANVWSLQDFLVTGFNSHRHSHVYFSTKQHIAQKAGS